METIKRITLPVDVATLREFIIHPMTQASVDYGASSLKGRTALIYLTNTNVNVKAIDVTGVDREEVYNLIDAYIMHKSPIMIEPLVASVQLLLLTVKRAKLAPPDLAAFEDLSLIKASELDAYMADAVRLENLARLTDVLDNLPVYIARSNKQVTDDTHVQEVNDINYTGLTFVHLLTNDVFLISYLATPIIHTPKFFTQQFSEYIYQGKNLFSFITDTPLVALADMIVTGQLDVPQLEQFSREIDGVV